MYRMYRKMLFWMEIVVLSLIICGCVSTMGTNSSSTQVEPAREEGLAISPPERMIGDLSQQPAHIKFVLAAMVNKLRGERDAIPEVIFDPKGKHAFYDDSFTYDEFDLKIVQITGFEILNQTNKEAQLAIEGVFNFKDLFGRGIATYFAAGYTVEKNRIIITKSGTALIAPAIPDIEAFYVPKSSFDGINMKEISCFMDLYLHALFNAVNMEPSEKERQDKKAYDELSVWKKLTMGRETATEDYYIMAFCKDRLPPEASLEIIVTDKPQMQGNYLSEPGYVYDQGWRVLIAGGNFCPDALKDNLYVNIQYNTNPESTQRSISIGSYTNQKNYEDSPKYIIKPIAARESPSMDQTSPIASGSNFLDPGQDSDARLIQTRLAEKGYYTKNIDGDFGSGSKAALKNFKKDSGLSDDSTWDLKTQQILFKNSGL